MTITDDYIEIEAELIMGGLDDVANSADQVAQDIEYLLRKYGAMFDPADRALLRADAAMCGAIAVELGI